MFKERTPGWIMAGGFLLTALAGSVNAVGFLGVYHQPISHLTGTLTQFGSDVVRGEGELAWRTGSLLLSFFGGATLSAFILKHEGLRTGRRYGAVLIIQSAILGFAFLALQSGHWWGENLAAGACGLQNAMATSYSGAVIRSTHMTGIITDLAIALGQRLRGLKVDAFKLRLYGVLLAGFSVGSAFGTWGYLQLGYAMLLIPASLCGVTGLVHALIKHWERQRGKHYDPAIPAK